MPDRVAELAALTECVVVAVQAAVQASLQSLVRHAASDEVLSKCKFILQPEGIGFGLKYLPAFHNSHVHSAGTDCPEDQSQLASM
jgi:hypothetical protein